MLPYISAAHKYHYARFGLYYFRSIKEECREKILKGDQALRLKSGINNGVISDQFTVISNSYETS